MHALIIHELLVVGLATPEERIPGPPASAAPADPASPGSGDTLNGWFCMITSTQHFPASLACRTDLRYVASPSSETIQVRTVPQLYPRHVHPAVIFYPRENVRHRSRRYCPGIAKGICLVLRAPQALLLSPRHRASGAWARVLLLRTHLPMPRQGSPSAFQSAAAIYTLEPK